MSGTAVCPGCRAIVPVVPELRTDHLYVGAAPGCWVAYTELIGLQITDPRLFESRMLSVDVYMAQHPGVRGRQASQSVWGHLVGLCLSLEFDFDGVASARAKARLLALKATFEWLEPPASLGRITVFDALEAAAPEEHIVAIDRWAASVWAAWAPYAERVRRRAEDLLPR